ncbi:MAG: 5'-methylthioadenosine/S-adenosylhomocysteine nucleosidase [Myxococcales bacterium]|nr:5'-methylthioadenosine/S-adenosylhomocysteine nucleosidase [Myxococcales bacterium]
MTAVAVERDAILRLMKPLPGHAQIREAPVKYLTYYVGVIGEARVVLTMCRPGAIDRDGSIIATTEAIQACQPRSVIAAGIAFGGYTEKLKIGDVLVSNRVISYEPARKQAGGDRPRGSQREAGKLLLNRFRNVLGWCFERPDRRRCSFVEGLLLSGEKLVDDLDFKVELFEQYPESIGGEMEGAGMAAVAASHNIEWIVVKAVCDWGDGTKSDNYQPLAAAAAASLVAYVVAPRTALADLPESASMRLKSTESRGPRAPRPTAEDPKLKLRRRNRSVGSRPLSATSSTPWRHDEGATCASESRCPRRCYRGAAYLPRTSHRRGVSTVGSEYRRSRTSAIGEHCGGGRGTDRQRRRLFFPVSRDEGDRGRGRTLVVLSRQHRRDFAVGYDPVPICSARRCGRNFSRQCLLIVSGMNSVAARQRSVRSLPCSSCSN